MYVCSCFCLWSNCNILQQIAEQGTLNVIRQAEKAGIKRIVVTSSTSTTLSFDGKWTPESEFYRCVRLPDLIFYFQRGTQSPKKLHWPANWIGSRYIWSPRPPQRKPYGNSPMSTPTLMLPPVRISAPRGNIN